MRINNERLTGQELELLNTLCTLRAKLDQMTMEQYQRINPLMENITDWRERGEEFGAKGVIIHDSTTVLGDVSFSKNVWVGSNCLIDGSGGLRIGKSCTIATGCQIYSHDTIKNTLSGGLEDYDYAEVVIGNNVFIGAASIILKGVSIGNHCVVGANSTVTKSVEPYSIVAGSPARVIGKVCLNNGKVELKYY